MYGCILLLDRELCASSGRKYHQLFPGFANNQEIARRSRILLKQPDILHKPVDEYRFSRAVFSHNGKAVLDVFSPKVIHIAVIALYLQLIFCLVV